MKQSFPIVLWLFAYSICVNILFSGCGDVWFETSGDAIDTLDAAIAKAPSAETKNENWMTPGSKIIFNNANGISREFTVSKYGNSCDCGNEVSYSKYTNFVFASNDSDIYFDSAQKSGIPKIDSFFKAGTQPDLGSLAPIPRIPQTNYPIFIDDSGKKVLFFAYGSDHRVYYEPYGLIYSRSYSSCGTFCGYRNTTVLSKYNGAGFDYLGAIGVAKGLYDKWIQFRKSDEYAFLVRDTSGIKRVLFDRYPVWSKGDPILSKRPQMNSSEQVWIRIEGFESSSEYVITGSTLDSLIITAPADGLRFVHREIETSFF